jgi:dethiobiotin synthetase
MKNTKNHTRIFVSGIGTGVGKTVVSAVLVKVLRAAYWKPVQSGDLECSDSLTVAKLINDSALPIMPEAYRLQAPLSPDASAAREGIRIDHTKLAFFPETQRPLVIEGGGGLYVPLNEEYLYIDYIQEHALPVVLVSRHYLGSINHTLLSLAALKERGIQPLGIVFNGDENKDTERSIARFSHVPVLGRIEEIANLNSPTIERWAASFADHAVLRSLVCRDD